MKFEQPKLPYSPDALAPVISQETIEYHYGKHEKTYIDNLNRLIEGTSYADESLEEIVKTSDGALFNNASQALNHLLYFFQFNPDGKKEPEGDLRRKIDETYGSFDEFKKQFEAAGAAVFGSGWVWLSEDESGQLFLTATSNAGNPLTDGLKPLLVFDVWEHAYYLDYQNLRATYLNKLWDIVDWNVIETRY